MALVIKNQPTNAGDIRDVGSTPGWEDPLEETMATHSNMLPWRTPSRGAWRATVHMVAKRHDWSNLAGMHTKKIVANTQQIQVLLFETFWIFKKKNISSLWLVESKDAEPMDTQPMSLLNGPGVLNQTDSGCWRWGLQIHSLQKLLWSCPSTYFLLSTVAKAPHHFFLFPCALSLAFHLVGPYRVLG